MLSALVHTAASNINIEASCSIKRYCVETNCLKKKKINRFTSQHAFYVFNITHVELKKKSREEGSESKIVFAIRDRFINRLVIIKIFIIIYNITFTFLYTDVLNSIILLNIFLNIIINIKLRDVCDIKY